MDKQQPPLSLSTCGSASLIETQWAMRKTIHVLKICRSHGGGAGPQGNWINFNSWYKELSAQTKKRYRNSETYNLLSTKAAAQDSYGVADT